jgi:hypothetical protein
LPLATAPVIVADRQSARLDAAAVSTDVAAFERLLRDGTPEALEQATALYRGDFLDGIGIRDPAFEDWLLVERQRLRQLVEDALTKLLTQSMAAGEQERAAAAARRLLSLDPLREAACRALMQIHAELAQTAQALKLYDALRDRLHRELGVKPERCGRSTRPLNSTPISPLPTPWRREATPSANRAAGWPIAHTRSPRPRGWGGERENWAGMTPWLSVRPVPLSRLSSTTSKAALPISIGLSCSIRTWLGHGSPAL